VLTSDTVVRSCAETGGAGRLLLSPSGKRASVPNKGRPALRLLRSRRTPDPGVCRSPGAVQSATRPVLRRLGSQPRNAADRGAPLSRRYACLRRPGCPASGVQSNQEGNLPLVPWVPHLTKADIRSYIAGTGSLGADRHVRTCPYCALRAANATTDAVWWERRGPLGRLVRVDVSQEIDKLLAEMAEEQRHDAA
jgi:hypothetical protein